MNHILLFNPWAGHKPRIPNSVLQVAASVNGKYEWVIVDGNLEKNPLQKIEEYFSTHRFKYFGLTVMPGPQLQQAIPISKYIRKKFPDIKIIWGGYFASNQYRAVLNSGVVDFVMNGPGDIAFPQLIHALENNKPVNEIHNLIFKKEDELIKTKKDDLIDQDTLPDLPYRKLSKFYPVKRYLGRTYLGSKTIAYHSSVGCPFTCSFCAVVPIYEARWKAKSAQRIYADIKFLKEEYGGNAIEFHDNNFFVSEKRTVEFSRLIENEKMNWWGEGRIDTIDKYSDHSLEKMREAGCRMIFFGAETGNDAILKQMDKGGTQSSEQIKRFAARMKRFDIIPEYSFVLGMPAPSSELVMQQIDSDIQFIRSIKEINPECEIIIYVYSPVPTEGSQLFDEAKKTGFHFPETLDEWISPQWENFDLRKNPATPWLTSEMVDKIKNFETVLNGYFPTISDVKLSGFQRKVMRTISSWRYKSQFINFPYEIKALQKFWLKYRQPEIEGF